MKNAGGAGTAVAWQLAAFASVLFGIKLWLIGSYGNATPFWDQWDAEAALLYRPYLEGRLGWAELFAAHNEHRIFMTRLLAMALLELNGSWNPLLQMVVNAALHVSFLAMVALLLARVTRIGMLPALLAFSLVLFGVPYAWENTLSGFQSQFYLVLIFSVTSIWFTVRHEPLSGFWWLGGVCAVLAYLSLASGVFAPAAAAAIGTAQWVTGLRRTRRQFVAVVVLLGLFGLGVALTPTPAGQEAHRAASIRQFLEAIWAVTSWPFPASPFTALLRNLPLLAFAIGMARLRPPAGNAAWILATLVLWAMAQTVSIAYGRAAGSLASRYTDLFAIAVLVNFACLIWCALQLRAVQRNAAFVAAGIWTALSMASLLLLVGRPLPTDLAAKRDLSQAQETHVHDFVLSGDRSHLFNKPHMHLPHPSPEHLVSILSSRHIRSILPSNIRPPLDGKVIERNPEDGFVTGGYYPTTPVRPGMTLGSYGIRGDAGVGDAVIGFGPIARGGVLAIPVAGYPTREGIRIDVEQEGSRNQLRFSVDPKEHWELAHARVAKGPFAIIVADRSSSTWISVGAPTILDGLGPFTLWLLGSFRAFLLLGGGIAAALMMISILNRLRS